MPACRPKSARRKAQRRADAQAPGCGASTRPALASLIVPQQTIVQTTCSKCHTRPPRKNQRTCLVCHALYAKWHRERRARDLVALIKVVRDGARLLQLCAESGSNAERAERARRLVPEMERLAWK